jgi:hypothetical protein
VNASLISGLSDPAGMAVEGNTLFVANAGIGTIGEYSTSGATYSASLISGLIDPRPIALGPPPQLDITAYGRQNILFYPQEYGTNFVFQTVTNLTSTNWVTVTNTVPIYGVLVTNNLPAGFFRIAPSQ